MLRHARQFHARKNDNFLNYLDIYHFLWTRSSPAIVALELEKRNKEREKQKHSALTEIETLLESLFDPLEENNEEEDEGEEKGLDSDSSIEDYDDD